VNVTSSPGMRLATWPGSSRKEIKGEAIRRSEDRYC
jgi:hypothetical protein